MVMAQADQFLENGNKFMQVGDWQRAIVEFEKGLEIAEYDLEIAERLADAYLASGKRDDYIDEYKQLTKDDYTYPTNHFILGILRLDKADELEYENNRRDIYPRAIESFAIAIAFGADEALSRYYLGRAYEMDYTWGKYDNPSVANLEKYNDSIEHYEKAIQFSPEFLPAYVRLAIIYLVTGNLERALQQIETAVSIMPDNADAIYWLAHFSYLAGNYEDAVSYGLHATQINPNDAAAYGLLGLAYAQLDEKLLAIAMLRQGLNLGLPSSWAWYRFQYQGTLNALTR